MAPFICLYPPSMHPYNQTVDFGAASNHHKLLSVRWSISSVVSCHTRIPDMINKTSTLTSTESNVDSAPYLPPYLPPYDALDDTSMTLLGIGIDILSLERFHGVVHRRGIDRVARRICSPRELVEFRSLPVASRPAGSGCAEADNETVESLLERQFKFLSTRCVILSN